MKTILALAFAAALVSGSARAQDGKKYVEVTPEQAQAQVKIDTKPAAPTINVEEIARQKLAQWQQKKHECFTKAGLTNDVHYRQNPADPTNFQVKESVYLGGFNVPAVKKCVDLKLSEN